MINHFHRATVLRIEAAGSIVKRFYLQVDTAAPFIFKAGQFIALKLKSSDGDVVRYYSVASAPSSDNILELCIAFKPGGSGSDLLWHSISAGSEVEVSDAMGKLILQEPIENEICFIATGTGIAPLRSMISHIYQNNLEHHQIRLIFGVRSESDILYRNEFESLAQQHPEFIFTPVLSRPDTSWKGASGYVHETYLQQYADNRACTFYLCGWGEMVREARANLEKMEYTKDAIRYESYG